MEQTEDPETMQKLPREPSPIPARNKVGNGLVCKNRKSSKPSATATSSSNITEAATTSEGAEGIIMIMWINFCVLNIEI